MTATRNNAGLLTTAELSQRIGLSTDIIRKRLRRPELAGYVVVVGPLKAFRESDVQDLDRLLKQTTAAGAA